jgi:hypothetical protein
MNRISYSFFFLIFCLISFVSCEAPEVNPFDRKVIENNLNKQIDEYLKLRLFNCREEILRDAEIYVDSMIAVQLSFSINEGLIFPPRPNRPKPITNIRLDDTTKAIPFLKYSSELIIDTLKTGYKNGKN